MPSFAREKDQRGLRDLFVKGELCYQQASLQSSYFHDGEDMAFTIIEVLVNAGRGKLHSAMW